MPLDPADWSVLSVIRTYADGLMFTLARDPQPQDDGSTAYGEVHAIEMEPAQFDYAGIAWRPTDDQPLPEGEDLKAVATWAFSELGRRIDPPVAPDPEPIPLADLLS